MIRAYSIALIPTKEVIERCYQINQTITDRNNIAFRTHGQLPHITLLMGGLDNANLQSIKSELTKLLNKLEPIKVTLTGIHEGRFASGIKIAPNIALNNLHKEIFLKFGSSFNNKVSIENVVGLPNVTEGTANIINNYKNKSVLENFDPHITIGDGIPTISKDTFPIMFSSKDVRIAPMGNYCTFVSTY